jgi:putative intracellular protease/amidase
VGGQGASIYYDNPKAHVIARETLRSGKLLGAACLAPATLAKAGVLRGKTATSFLSVQKVLPREKSGTLPIFRKMGRFLLNNECP